MNRLNNITFVARTMAVAACASVLASCSTETDLESRGVIRLGVSEPASRAAINSVADLSQYGKDKVGVFGLEIDRNAPVLGAWSGNLVMKNVRTSDIDAAGTLHWTGTYYYPLEKEHYVEFFAYHPYAEITESGSSYVEFTGTDAAPVLHFTVDGSQDVLYTDTEHPVIGNIASAPDKLRFRHALTRLTFALSDPDGGYAGATLNGITFQQVNTSGSMNIENGRLDTWSAPLDLPMPMSPVAIDAQDQIQAVSGEMMLEPGRKEFFITVHTSYGDVPNVRITPKTNADGSTADTFAAEQSYRITLKFAKKQTIQLSAAVEEWKFGGYGYGVVQ